MFLEIATTFGAIAGAFAAARVAPNSIAIVFGLLLTYSAFISIRTMADHIDTGPADPIATRLRLDGAFPTRAGQQSYHVRNVPGGFGCMFVAGVLSGLLGIGSGAVKVLAMDQVMRIPFKVSTTTSNFMIGVTAAASAGIYLSRGYVDPGLAMPVVLGVLVGSLFGSRALIHAQVRSLRLIFSFVILALAIEMIYNGLNRRF
jgi:uncharacterized membrane protein YfcA